MRGKLSSLVALGLLASRSVWAADVASPLDLLNGGKAKTSAETLKEVRRWSDLSSWPTSLTFTPDDSALVVGMKEQLQVIPVTGNAEPKVIPLKSGQIRCLAYSPDGSLLAAGGYQNVTLFRANFDERVRDLKGHRGYVTGVAFAPDGSRLATSCEDEVVRIWSLNGDDAPLVIKGFNLPVMGITWSNDGNRIAVAIGDDTRPTKHGQVKVIDALKGEVVETFELHQKAATGVAFSPDGHFLLSTSVDERVNVYDLANKKPLGYFAGHSRPTNAVIVHPDGETAISISGGRAVGKNELLVWEFETGEPVAAVEAHEGKITSLALSHDGRFVATGGYDRSVAVWNVGFLAVGLPSTPATPTQAQQVLPADALIAAAASTAVAVAAADTKAEQPKMLRAGIIGLDTSHAPAFAKTMNAEPPVAGAENCRVVAAYPKGSPDIKSSLERVPEYTEALKKLGVEIVDSIEDLLPRVDVILLETNDGRPHFEQIIPCLKAGKPVFIDKPIAGSLVDAIAIFEAARKYRVPVFSASSLRFGKNSLAVRAGSIGTIQRAETSSPASLEPSHPDLFWYGIHGVESLFTVMGPGCVSVVRSTTPEGKIEVTGQWSDGRVGIYREGGGYTGKAIGDKGEAAVGSYDGYDPLVFAIVKFFQTGQPPVAEEETLQIYAFMEAADESKRQKGASVTLESVMSKARAEAAKKVAALK